MFWGESVHYVPFCAYTFPPVFFSVSYDTILSIAPWIHKLKCLPFIPLPVHYMEKRMQALEPLWGFPSLAKESAKERALNDSFTNTLGSGGNSGEQKAYVGQ